MYDWDKKRSICDRLNGLETKRRGKEKRGRGRKKQKSINNILNLQ